MSELQPDGSSKKDNLMVVKKTTGITPKELENEPVLDEMFEECWDWFLRLNNRRSTSEGVGTISYSDIKAFFELLQYQPQQWELDIIELFDSVAVKEYSAQLKKRYKAQSK